MRVSRALILMGAALGLSGLALLGAMYREARADPIVRHAEMVLPGLPPGRHVDIVLLSDIHAGSAAMDARRLRRIVAQVNALHPDLVLIAGDFIAGHEPGSAARLGVTMIEPLAGLRARFGTAAVLGNHDYRTGAAAVRRQLSLAGITVLENQATVLGPLAIGGIGDDPTGHADPAATISALRTLGPPFVFLGHSPDSAPLLHATAPMLLLAGHTHCGQIVLPVLGIAPDNSRFGARYRCGLIREGNRTLIVTAGLGTSILPLRLGAPPDLWLITVRGPAAIPRTPIR